MSVLFALSLLAFVALLWATISIAGFVRRQRRRRRRRAADAAEGLPTGAVAPSPVFYREPGAAVAEVTSDDPGAPPPPRLRNFPTRLGKQPAADDGRPAWNPFGKDLADLSDPVAKRHVPGSRVPKRDNR